MHNHADESPWMSLLVYMQGDLISGMHPWGRGGVRRRQPADADPREAQLALARLVRLPVTPQLLRASALAPALATLRLRGSLVDSLRATLIRPSLNHWWMGRSRSGECPGTAAECLCRGSG